MRSFLVLLVFWTSTTTMSQSSGSHVVASKLRSAASEALTLRRRRDDEISAVSVLQMATGVWLCFVTSQEARTLQLFVAGKFYERAVGLLVLRADSDAAKGDSRRKRAAKRVASAVLLGAAAVAPPELRRLAPTLAIGAAAARSTAAVVEQARAVFARERALHRATRAVTVADHPDQQEYLRVAREAVRKAVEKNSRRQQSLPQRVEGATTLAATVLSTFVVARFVPRFRNGLLETFAPCVVGSFEAARGSRRFVQVNAFLLRGLRFELAARVIRTVQKPALLAVASVIGFLGRASSKAAAPLRAASRGVKRTGRAFERLQARLFGNEYFFYDLLHGTKLGAALRTVYGLALLKPAKLVNSLVSAAQRVVARVLKDNHDALWPWVVATAGYQVRIGAISRFPGVPKYLASMAALPTAKVAVFVVGLLNAGAGLLKSFALATLPQLLLKTTTKKKRT